MSAKRAKAAGLLLLAAAALLAGCERPPTDVVQRGYRGTGMEVVYNPRTIDKQLPGNLVPEYAPQASPDGPKAKAIYQNVKVLGDLSIAQFNRTMATITQWVAPVQGCAYCHNPQDFADDGKYTKVVARRMIEMTQHVNSEWKNHVAATGVTCYTCHRGNPVPTNLWFTAPAQDKRGDFIGNLEGQNVASESVRLASLPYDPFTPFLLDSKPIRVYGTTALPTGGQRSLKDAETTYSLMFHLSTALGVSCSYCHNTRSFGSWDSSPPQRATAWYGIRMVRDLNNAYLVPLKDTFPAERLGPTGDAPKVNCATCHQGAYKPLYGTPIAKDFPELQGAVVEAAAPN
jgi:photosynthetic reaction center cytochrome c subunit